MWLMRSSDALLQADRQQSSLGTAWRAAV